MFYTFDNKDIIERIKKQPYYNGNMYELPERYHYAFEHNDVIRSVVLQEGEISLPVGVPTDYPDFKTALEMATKDQKIK